MAEQTEGGVWVAAEPYGYNGDVTLHPTELEAYRSAAEACRVSGTHLEVYFVPFGTRLSDAQSETD